MASKSTFVRSDPSMLVIPLTDNELEYRAGAAILNDQKKLLEEKIRCSACKKQMKNVFTKGDVSFHPSFEVIICKDCEEFYASGEFSVDEDGSDKYCRWCGQGGSLYCCSNCSVAICEKCVGINFPKKYVAEIEDDDWECFICDSKPIWPHRAIAAAVREYIAEQKFTTKSKRRYSDDSDGLFSSKNKKARKDHSPCESKIVIDSSDETTDSRAKRSKVKKNGSASHKASKRGVIKISDDEEDDARSVTNRSRKAKSKKQRKREETEDESEDENVKPRRSLKKSMADSKETDESSDVDSRRKSTKLNSSKHSRSNHTNRLSKKIVTADDELDSDQSVFRDKSHSKTSSRQSTVKSKSSTASRRRVSSGGCEGIDYDAVRMFQHLLKDSLKDTEKLLKIAEDSKNSFRDKYVNEKKYLRNYEDVGVAKEKYLGFLRNLVSSTKRIEETFFSGVEPLINSADSKRAAARTTSSPSPTRNSKDASKLTNGVSNESSVEGAEKSVAEDKAEESSPSKMEVDENDHDETDVDAAKPENISNGLIDVDKTSTPAPRRESTSSNQKGADHENDAISSSEREENPKPNEEEMSSPSTSMMNGLEEISSRIESTNENDTTVDLGVSDSMIVNLGTEDESMSEKESQVEPAKEKSDDDLAEKSKAESAEEKSDGDDLAKERDSENCRSGEWEHEKNSLASGNDGQNSDVGDDKDDTFTVNEKSGEEQAKNDLLQDVSDVDENDTCIVNDKSKEELAKDDLLRNSENSSENETDDCISSDKEAKKRSQEDDPTLLSRLPSPDLSLQIEDSNGEPAKSNILKESDGDVENNEIESNDVVDKHSTEDFAKSEEKSAKKELLESSDSSANDHHSKSSSDSGMSGVDVLQKNSDNKKSRQKRRTKRLSSNELEARRGNDTSDDDKEINRLTNLKTLKGNKAQANNVDSNEEEIRSDSEKENLKSKSNTKKSEKKSTPRKSLEDYIADGSDNDSDIDEDPFKKLNSLLDEKKFRNSTMTQNDFCKQQLLDSSDSNNGNESDTEDDLVLPSKPKKEKKNCAKKEETDESSKSGLGSCSENDKEKKKRASWRNDGLLRTKLLYSDSSDEEKIAARIRKREAADLKKKNDSCHSSDSENLFRTEPATVTKKKRRVLKSSTDDSSSDSVKIIEKKETKKRKQPRKRIKNIWTDSDDNSQDEDVNDSQNAQGSASKGRKNIRQILKDEELAAETRVTAKQEEDRKRRIAERQALFNEVFQVVDVEAETPKQLVLDFDPKTKTELVSVHPDLVKKLKPHQIKGVKFMWDSCFESIKQIEKSSGSGCILAHCMGLGKTLQVVALVHTVLRFPATTIKKVLIICPVSTILNWVKEFKTWLHGLDDDDECDIDIRYFNKNQKNAKDRAYLLKRWAEDGGVMILGYDMFRILINSKTLPKKWKDSIHEALLDPGADLVVCDEGHTLKNEKSAISVAAMKIRTRRRIVLTGTPLQNNLIEYHCMVQFVKPSLLGDKKEFQNRFANPITNGQFTNSTSHDVRVMKRRSHVLHKMLDGIVQRFDYNVLTPFLPPKHEFVISVSLSDLQAKLYEHYIKTFSRISGSGENRSLFKDYQIMRLIWTHPFAMNKSFEKRMKLEAKEEEEDSMDDFIVSGSDDESRSDSEKSCASSVISVRSGASERPRKIKTRKNKDAEPPEDAEPDLEIDPKAGAWWRPFITDEDIDDYKQGPKLVLLFAILRECELIGDKVLIFSQSIPSLDMIEHFLKKTDEFSQYGSLLDVEGSADYLGTWRKNIDYFRLDGSTPSEVRTEYTNRFNHSLNQRARLFLISTKAGGLGINLTAANRVIIFDASWNPSHDVQSIFRVYRFGQTKPCYIYRFLSQGTMEEKIYERQVTKLSISCRVVDEQQIDRHFSRNEIEELYTFVRKSPSEDEIPRLPKDRLMAEILKKFKSIIISYHEHDSLLENIVDEELTEEERKQAWEEYENDKKPKFVQPVYQQFPYDGLNVSDETIMKSLRQQNPNATPEQLEEMKKKVRLKIYQYCHEQQRKQALLGNQQNIQVASKKELDEQLEMRRRALAYNMLMQDKTNSAQGQNSGSSSSTNVIPL